jgi:hypothetical protein
MPPYNLLGTPQQLPLGSLPAYSTPTFGPNFNLLQNTAPDQSQPKLSGQTSGNTGPVDSALKQTAGNQGLMSTVLNLFGL